MKAGDQIYLWEISRENDISISISPFAISSFVEAAYGEGDYWGYLLRDGRLHYLKFLDVTRGKYITRGLLWTGGGIYGGELYSSQKEQGSDSEQFEDLVKGAYELALDRLRDITLPKGDRVSYMCHLYSYTLHTEHSYLPAGVVVSKPEFFLIWAGSPCTRFRRLLQRRRGDPWKYLLQSLNVNELLDEGVVIEAQNKEELAWKVAFRFGLISC